MPEEKRIKIVYIKDANENKFAVLVENNEVIELGQFIYLEGIEGSFPVHKISYYDYNPYSENYLYKFAGIDQSTPKIETQKKRTYYTNYEDFTEFTYNKHRYGQSNGICIRKSVAGHELLDLSDFYYHNLKMEINNFDYKLCTDHCISGAIVSDNHRFYSKNEQMLFDKNKETVISCFDFVETAIVPETVRKVKKDAFGYNKNLKKIIFKGFIEEIEGGSFINCEKLEEIVFEDGVNIFYLNYINNCPNIEYVRCNSNEKSKITGTIYMNDITYENCCWYIRVEDNPYYFFFKGGVDIYPEDIYEWPDDERYDNPTDEMIEECLVLRAEDQEIQRAIVNNKVVVFCDSVFCREKEVHEITYENGEKLYFTSQLNDKRTYDKNIMDFYYKNSYVKYRIMVNRLKNKHLLGGLSKENEESLISSTISMISDNHIRALIKYKWYDEIIELCNTGVLSLEQVYILSNHYDKKKEINLEIQKALHNYISSYKRMLFKISQLPGKRIKLSNKIVDFNRYDVEEELINLNKYYWTFDNEEEKPDLVITGVNDEELIDECERNGIRHIPSSKFRFVKDKENFIDNSGNS